MALCRQNQFKKINIMNMLKKFSLGAALCALLSFSLTCGADEIQDANKLFKQGQNAQALEKVNAFLATKPKDAQARFLKGLIVNEQGDTNAAIKIFSDLTDDYPELPEPYNNLAVLYASQGQYEKAKVALELAIRTHPSYATAHENLGDIYAKMASQAYDRALQLDKSNTTTQTKLALIRDLFGKGTRTTKAAATPAAAAAATPATTAVTAPATTAPGVTPVAAAPVAVPVSAAPVAKPVVAAAPVATTPVAPVAAKPVVAAVAPVAAPAAPKAEAAPADVDAEVLKATRDWAAAWSAKNSRKYLSFYAKEFKTPDGEDRGTWEEQRKERIAKPKTIHVEVNEPKVKVLDGQHASVSFRQTYRASHLNTNAAKTLVWVKENGQWRIAEERSGK